MEIKVLASGSKGNATFIGSKETKLLIDFGLSFRAINQRLNSVGEDIDSIDAILITHEHSDHIRGLLTLTKKKNIPIYLSQGTLSDLKTYHKIDGRFNHFYVIKDGDSLAIGDLCITPFDLSHDANEPLGFVIYEGDKKFVYLTDTGFVSQRNEERIKDADVYILETNHNIEMLMCSSRPWYLKQRILGDYGHLCNEDAFEVLSRVKGRNTKYVYLAHISEEVNNEDLLILTAKSYFADCIDDMRFIIAHQHKVSKIVEV